MDSNQYSNAGNSNSTQFNQPGLPQQYQPMMQSSFYPQQQQQQQQVPQFHQFQQTGYPPNISHQAGGGQGQGQQSGSNGGSDAAAQAAAQAAAAAGDFNYSQMANPSTQQMNQHQLSELMYNSFLTHLAQKQMPNSTGSANPAGSGSMQKQFGENAATLQNNLMMDPMHQQQLLQQQMLQQQAMQQQALQQSMQSQLTTGKKGPKGKNGNQQQSGAASGSGKNGKNKDVKKLSSTQTRIEKRKQLKKQGPKRPSSAYFLFSMSIRNELLQEHPHAKVPELSKLASIRWKDLTDEQKKPFYDEFRTNWEKYRVLRDEYEKTLPPKRPSGPFIQFTQDIRPLVVKENPERNLIEITKIIGEKWRQLDPVKKAEYTENYRIRLKEWESCYPEEAEEENLKVKVKKPRKKKVKNATIDPNATNPNDLNQMNVMNPMGNITNINGMPSNAGVNQN